MCHADATKAFPKPARATFVPGPVAAYRFGAEGGRRVAILPDIYGCNPFYRGLATRFVRRGAEVFLVDPFHPFGDLAEPTREAAFERRHKVRDRAFVDALAVFLAERRIGAVVGFCLGGLYVFELARRDLALDLVAYYPFPQGLPNQDALDTPFDYLPRVTRRHAVLFGSEDRLLGRDNLERLQRQAAENPAIALTVYPGSDHGFLGDIESDDPGLRANAEASLATCEGVVLGPPPPAA